MNKLNKLLIAVGATLLTTACENDKYSEELPAVKDNVSFKLDVEPIIVTQCAGCHNPANIGPSKGPDFRAGFAYDALLSGDGIVPGDAESSELMEMLQGGGDNPMPPAGKISPLKIAIIAKWIDEGALNN